MALFASSYVPTGGATATRNIDILPLPFPARPQAMTGYVRFVEQGSILINGARIFQISNAANEAPALLLNSNATNYRCQHQNDTGIVTVVLAAAPSIGAGVELVVQLSADGSIVLIQSIGGAASTTTAASSALVLAVAWSSPTLLHINNVDGTSGLGFNAFRNIVFHRGVQSLTTMRRLANVI